MRSLAKALSVIAIAAFGALAATATPIRLKCGEVDTSPGLAKSAAASLYAAEDSVRVYLVQCDGAISPEWRSTVERAGGKILGYVPDNAYLVAADQSAAAALASQVKYAYFGDYRPEYKVSAAVKDVVAQAKTLKTASKDASFAASAFAGEFMLSVFRFAKAFDVAEKVAALDGCVVIEADGDIVRAKLSEAAVSEIPTWSEVEWLEPYVPEKSLNNVAVASPRMNVKTVWPSGESGLGLTGKGQVVAVCDTGLDTGNLSTLHEDIRGRVTRTYCYGRSNNWSDPNGHGTHVAGSVLGSGTKSSGSFKGVAYEANLIFQSSLNSSGGLSLPSDYKTIFQTAYNAESSKPGARIHSNSWGSGSQDYSWNLGVYNSGSRAIDQFLFEHPDMLIFFAAGNEGVDYDGDGVIDPDSLCNQATAKNCMSVGAAENYRTGGGGYTGFVWATGSWAYNFLGNLFKSDYVSRPYDGTHQGMAAFSSRGPCDDGRIKPDIVAPGTDVLSLHSSVASGWGWGKYDSFYEYMGGTSMATPLTAGAAVLVRQWLVEKQGIANPDGATVKAVMLAGAKSLTPGQYGTGTTREIPASYPNNVEGWGQVNLGNALANASGVAVFDGKVIEHGETQECKVSVGSAGKPLAIVMAYMDAPASLSASAQLVNDLDLTVTTPSGATLYPNSRTSPDRVNNVEGVRIDSAQKGVYTVKVRAYSVTSPMSTTWTGGKANATRYSVAVNGATQSAALEVGECFLSNQSSSLDSASRVAKFSKGETIYAYGRIHNPEGVDYKDGFAVKHALQKGGVSKGSVEDAYDVTIAANGDFDLAHYAWSGLQNLAVGIYTYSFTLTAPGAAPVQRTVSFEVEDSPLPLDSVTLLGPSTVDGGSRTDYTCRALLADGTEVRAEPVWTIDTGSSYASIDQDGTLNAYATETPRVVVIRATCTYNRVTRSGTKTVAINPVVPLPVALDCPTWTISCGGDAEWFGQKDVTQDGMDAAQSGSVSHNQTSWFETSVEGVGTLSFWYRVSTEQNWDSLVVSVDGEEHFTASGESDWVQHSIMITGTGCHVVRFAYNKDVSLSWGEDAVYLDRLAWTLVPTPVSVSIMGESSVRAGSSLQLEGAARMSDGSERSHLNSECTWEVTSGSSYATISQSGLLTAYDSTTDHSVVVKAAYAAGGVTKSATRTIAITGVEPMPSAPVITRSGAGDYSAAVLGWSVADNARSYRIYRSTGTSRPSLPLATVDNVLSYRDETVSPGVECRYWVSAVNTSGETVSGSAIAYRDVQLTVGASAVSFGAEGGTTNVTIKTNADIDCLAEGAWLSALFSADSLTVTALVNDSEVARVSSVTLTAAEGTAHPRTLQVDVSQAGVALPEQELPDLAFESLEMATDANVPSRLFAVGDVINLRYGWKNCGAGTASGTVTNLIEVGRRSGTEKSDSVDEIDIEIDVLTSDEQVAEVDLISGAARTDAFSSAEWQRLEPGVYIAKARLNAAESIEEEDCFNNDKGFRFAVRDPVEISPALDCANSLLVFQTENDQWYGTKGIGFDGEDCVMTRLLGDGQTNVLNGTAAGRGTLSFAYKVATEASCDVLAFKIDGTTVLTDSGIGEWKQVSFEVEAGEHTFAWTYAKDALGSDGDDCVYLDRVVWTPACSGEPPTGFKMSGTTFTSGVKLEWNEVVGALSYVVERADSYDGPWTVVANSQRSPASDETETGLGGVDYLYRIKSVYADGESGWSEPISGYRKVSIESIAGRTVTGVGGSDAVSKAANCIWKATVDCNWLTFDRDCGTNDFKLVYRFPRNDTGAERSCWVTVTGAPGTSHAYERTFKVTQRVPAKNGEVIGLGKATDCSLVFNNSSEFPWFGQTYITHAGKTAMRSAEISGDVSSRVEVAFARAGKLSFWWGTSSESSDILRFYIGNDEQFSLSGYDSDNPGEVMNWELKTVDIRTNGTVVAWEYSKGVSGDRGLDAGYVSEIVWMPATEEIVPPQTWFDSHPMLLERLGTTDLAVAAKMQSPGSEGSGGKKAADGSAWLVWMDYVCGTDPLDSNSKFQATIEIVDGVPKVEWRPMFEKPEDARLRNYLIHGKRDLKSADWTPVAEGHESEFNFFKVSVEMQ